MATFSLSVLESIVFGHLARPICVRYTVSTYALSNRSGSLNVFFRAITKQNRTCNEVRLFDDTHGPIKKMSSNNINCSFAELCLNWKHFVSVAWLTDTNIKIVIFGGFVNVTFLRLGYKISSPFLDALAWTVKADASECRHTSVTTNPTEID